MKPITKLFFIFTLLTFIMSSCDDSPDLIFRGIKSETAKHLGEGVWINVPPFYKKAKSYDGFQASNYESSISLQINYASIDNVIKSFDKKLLARKRTKLLTLETVKFGEADSAVYAEVYDKRKQTIRYLLSIKKDNKMYGVKAFCQERLKDKYDLMIKRALESVAFAELVQKEEAFVLGKLISLSEWYLTRDGFYPTASEDEAMIMVRAIDINEVGSSREYKMDFLKEEVAKYTSVAIEEIKAENVGDGHYITIMVGKGDKKVFGAYVTDGNEMSNLFIGSSNNLESIIEIGEYVRNQNIKTVLDVR